jgi:RNA polymerase sigma-70 factor (ECF subfamily)
MFLSISHLLCWFKEKRAISIFYVYQTEKGTMCRNFSSLCPLCLRGRNSLPCSRFARFRGCVFGLWVFLNKSDETDESLMARFVNTLDESAFTRLAERYHKPALRVACGMFQGMSLADDAVQEAFVRVVKNRDRYDSSRPFAAWFYTILRNICLDIRRKEVLFSNVIGAAVTQQSIVSEAHKPDMKIADILSGIEPEDQQILILKIVHGLKFSEVAEQLGCSEEAAKKRAQRALRRLKEVRGKVLL